MRTAVSDNDTTWGFDTEWYGDFVDGRETISVDPDDVTEVNLASAAFRWGCDVDFVEVGTERGGTVLYVVTGRDATDFVLRWDETVATGTLT